MHNTIDTPRLDRFVLIPDRGMYNGTNMSHVLNQGDGYIVSKSIRKSTKSEREWILEQNDYTSQTPEFRYKSRIIERLVKSEDGTKKKSVKKSLFTGVNRFMNGNATKTNRSCPSLRN